jgi:3-methyladenine DNA glycosylase/8-oxoguanine DNA glycosylase
VSAVAAGAIPLPKRAAARLTPIAPFHFQGTVRKPSHFPAPISAYRDGVYWQALRLGDDLLGVKMEDAGDSDRPAIDVTLFSNSPLSRAQKDAALGELSWRFDLASDLSPFNLAFRDDPLLGPIIERWPGMRVSASDSLYETLIIFIALQNATVRRTVQMMDALLSTYGTQLAFDGQTLYAFWKPEDLALIPEQNLRDLKVGYRAVTLLRTSKAFAAEPQLETSLRDLPRDEARRLLLALYGIGPASVDGLLFEFLHHYDALEYMPPWQGKIFSRLLFGAERPPAETLKEMTRRWGSWRALAALYVFEDLFWRHSRSPIPWLQDLIRL